MIANIILYIAKIEKSCFLIKLIKNFIVIIPTVKEINMPVMVSIDNSRSVTFKIAAPEIIGTDNKNVNLVAALFDNPTSLANKMVVPLLENPGIIASACDNPMMIACFKLIYSYSVSIM